MELIAIVVILLEIVRKAYILYLSPSTVNSEGGLSVARFLRFASSLPPNELPEQEGDLVVFTWGGKESGRDKLSTVAWETEEVMANVF